MKKRLFASLLMALVLSATSLSAFADSDATVTFGADSKLEYTDNKTETKVAPGETYVKTFELQNDNSHTADFYMNADVVKDFEAAGEKAREAGYEVKLYVKDGTVLYDSSLGGSQRKAGLSQMDIQDNVYLTTLKSKGRAELVLSIYLDGEGLDNVAGVTEYANSLTQIAFDFAAGYEAPTGNTVEYRTVTKKGETVYLPGRAAKTGDSMMVPALIAIVLLVGASLVVIGKKNKKAVKAMMLGGACALALLGTKTNAFAADEANTAVKKYTVTFRAGASGDFKDDSQFTSREIVVGQDASGNNITSDVYEISVSANEPITVFPEAVAKDGYVVDTTWVKTGTVVTKNMEFVADYKKLVNGVEYTIRYEDAATGESVYPQETRLGNVGDKVTANLPTVITISDAARYYPVSGQTVSMELKALDVSGDDVTNPNVLVIKYYMEPRTTSESVTTVVVEGDIVYTIVPGAGPAAAVNPGGAQGGQEAEVEENEATEENTEVTIEENETPLANGEGENGEVSIEDELTPLAPTPAAAAPAWIYILATLMVITAVGALLLVAKRKNILTSSEVDNNKDEQ